MAILRRSEFKDITTKMRDHAGPIMDHAGPVRTILPVSPTKHTRRLPDNSVYFVIGAIVLASFILFKGKK